MNESIIKRLPITLLSVSKTAKQPSIKRPNGAEWHQFIWVQEGVGTFRIENETFEVGKGKGVFTRKNVPNFYEGENLSTEWCAFDCDDEFINYVLGDKKYLVFDVPAFLENETEELRGFAMGNSTALELSALAYSYIIKLFSAVLRTEDDVIFEIKSYMQNNYYTVVTLDDIADKVNMDKYTMCRYYKQKCNTTIIDDLLKIRIEKSKRMLRYGNDRVEKIGEQCGFESPSYFCKKFKQIVGDSPLQYRKKHM